MTEYTTTLQGFQKAMEWSLIGTAEDAKAYAQALVTTEFYQVVNGDRVDYKDWIQRLVDWRGKTSDYIPVVKEFLRDGNRLAAFMTGTIKIEGAPNSFESFMFARVGKDGRMEWLIEHANWGPVAS